MNKQQKINTGVWASIALTLCTGVLVQWSLEGCGWWSLFAGCTMYIGFAFCGWVVVNDKIKKQ